MRTAYYDLRQILMSTTTNYMLNTVQCNTYYYKSYKTIIQRILAYRVLQVREFESLQNVKIENKYVLYFIEVTITNKKYGAGRRLNGHKTSVNKIIETYTHTINSNRPKYLGNLARIYHVYHSSQAKVFDYERLVIVAENTFSFY